MVMVSKLSALGLAAAIGLCAGTAGAESLSDRLKSATPQASELSLEVGCGRADKTNCALVVPAINDKTVASGVRLVPLESKGSVESMDALCAGLVASAVVQFDVYTQREAKTDCTGKVVPIGQPIYPYFAFVIAKADGPSEFSDIINALPDNQVLRVAVGGPGSGASVTLRNILGVRPELKSKIDITTDTVDVAMGLLRDGRLDALIVMDGPGSELLKAVSESRTAAGKPALRFVDFRQTDAVTNLRDRQGGKIYANVVLQPGFFSDIRTVMTPAALVVARAFYDKNTKAVDVLRTGVNDAGPTIAASLARPRDTWVSSFAKN